MTLTLDPATIAIFITILTMWARLERRITKIESWQEYYTNIWMQHRGLPTDDKD